MAPDYLVQVRTGGFWGWPYAYIGTNPQPGFAQMASDKVKASLAPDVLFEPHSAAMEFVFWTGAKVSVTYAGDAIVAL